MRTLSLLLLSLPFAAVLFFASCKKELPCDNCPEDITSVAGSKSPVAYAGTDQVIALPSENILLKSSASADPDKTNLSYKWAQIAGPVAVNIINAGAPETWVQISTAGVYQFELTLTKKQKHPVKNPKHAAKDTVQVVAGYPVVSSTRIACAGPDQAVTLPATATTLDGSCSNVQGTTAGGYVWRYVSGPPSFNITNPYAVQTQVSSLTEGVYQFELTVLLQAGMFSRDTVAVTVRTSTVVNGCDIGSRPLVNAQLVPVNTLSMAREGISVASAGNKILFAGGHLSGSSPVSRVDIFDITANSWSTAELSVPGSGLATAVLGNKIFFAGGSMSSRVDIYDASTNTWMQAELSLPRANMAAASAGNKVLFAGGISGFFGYSNRVDIYDATTNTWSVSALEGRTPTGTVGMTATAVGNKIYFAGEGSDWYAWDFGSISSTINIYDVSTNTWSISDLSIPRGFMAGIAAGTKNYWAGGLHKQPLDFFTNLVEIRDANTGSSTFGCLFQPNAFFSAVQKNNKIVFFTSGVDAPGYWTGPPPVHNKFDIYDIAANTWSIGVLPVTMYGTSIVSAGNTIYVAGGFVNGVLSNQVWKLEF